MKWETVLDDRVRPHEAHGASQFDPWSGNEPPTLVRLTREHCGAPDTIDARHEEMDLYAPCEVCKPEDCPSKHPDRCIHDMCPACDFPDCKAIHEAALTCDCKDCRA